MQRIEKNDGKFRREGQRQKISATQNLVSGAASTSPDQIIIKCLLKIQMYFFCCCFLKHASKIMVPRKQHHYYSETH